MTTNIFLVNIYFSVATELEDYRKNVIEKRNERKRKLEEVRSLFPSKLNNRNLKLYSFFSKSTLEIFNIKRI